MAHLCIQRQHLGIKQGLVSVRKTRFGTLYHAGDSVHCQSGNCVQINWFILKWVAGMVWSKLLPMKEHMTEIQPTFCWWSKCFNDVWNGVIATPNSPRSSCKSYNMHGVNTIKHFWCICLLASSDSHNPSDHHGRCHRFTVWCYRRHLQSCKPLVRSNGEWCSRWCISYRFHDGSS